MGDRRSAREWAVQLLFQFDFNAGEPEEAFILFWSTLSPPEKAKQFAEYLVRGVLDHQEDIDKRLQSYAENWDLKRMSAVDRNIMRVALFEMLHCNDIPPVVTINEAIEIAKSFSDDNSPHFVNGILDHARKTLDRPARTAAPSSSG
jgi:N utilization substance protein B